MKIKQFIENSLNHIQKLFPNATLAYEHKAHSDTHFIKVLPENVYQDDNFLDLEHELNDSFYSQGFEGDICFITKGALTELSNPTIVKPSLIQKSSELDFSPFLASIIEQGNIEILATQNNVSSFRYKYNSVNTNKVLEPSNNILFNHNTVECNDQILSDYAGNRNFAMAA